MVCLTCKEESEDERNHENKKSVENLRKKEVRTTVLNNLSLDIEEGDFIAVMGPSGAGRVRF